MKNAQNGADAEVRPQSAKTLTPNDDGPIVMLTRRQLSELMEDAVISALAEFEAGKTPGPDLLTGAQMATKLGVSRSKLHFLRIEGMPAIRVGTVYKFEPAAVLQYLREKGDK
jgi:hypothetical protein